jgi:hypothetical protein
VIAELAGSENPPARALHGAVEIDTEIRVRH